MVAGPCKTRLPDVPRDHFGYGLVQGGSIIHAALDWGVAEECELPHCGSKAAVLRMTKPRPLTTGGRISHKVHLPGRH